MRDGPRTTPNACENCGRRGKLIHVLRSSLGRAGLVCAGKCKG